MALYYGSMRKMFYRMLSIEKIYSGICSKIRDCAEYQKNTQRNVTRSNQPHIRNHLQ